MPRDTQIFSGADHAGNSDYTLPGNSEIEVLAVNANFKDNGAGADWCPAVVMFSDSGHVIARAMLPDVKVTAGGDAEVSFFPGVKPGGGSGGGTSTAYVSATLQAADPAETIPAGTSLFVGYPNVTISDPSVFTYNTVGSFTNDQLIVNKAGVVAARSMVRWENADFIRYSTLDTYQLFSNSQSADNSFRLSNPFGSGQWWAKDVMVGGVQAGDQISVRAFNADAANRNVERAELDVIWIG